MYRFNYNEQDEAILEVESNKFTIHSWLISGHNGDAYGKKTRILGSDEEIINALNQIKNNLLHRVHNKMITDQTQQKKDAENQIIKNKIESIIRGSYDT